MKIRNIILLGALGGAAWFGYGYFFGAPQQGGPMGGPVPVKAAEVIARDVTVWSDFSGRLEAVDHVEIRPRVAGMLESVHFEEGARVKKGALLFTIDPRPFEAEASRTKAALTSAEAIYGLAKLNHERAEKLVQERALSQSEADRRSNDFKVAQANVEAAKAALDNAKLNLEYAHITAPVSGRISRAEITVGNYIYTGGMPPLLATIVSESPVYASFEADEQTFMSYVSAADIDVSKIPVEIGVGNEEGTPHRGTVKSFDNQLSTGSGTIRVRAVVPNPDGTLLPGLFARVRLGGPGKVHALLIDDKAVGTDQSKKFVWVVSEDNKAVWREIKLGAVAEGLRVVTEGLSEGEKIIVGGTQRVQRPDTEVAPTMVPMGDDEKKE